MRHRYDRSRHPPAEPDEDLWELVPGDDPPEGAPPVEIDAMHVERPVLSGEATGRTGDDRGDDEHEPDVEELLERQHYAFPPAAAEAGAIRSERRARCVPGWPPHVRPLVPQEVAELLARERDRLADLLGVLRAEESAWGQEETAITQHAADAASATYEREVDRSLLTSVEAELAEVEAAQRRLSGHWYGWCEHCCGPIPAERLRAEPATRWCVEHRVEAARESS